MSDLYQYLKNGRGRIRCYWCKIEMSEAGPWAIRMEALAFGGLVPVCYEHSNLPFRKLIEELHARVATGEDRR